MLLVKTYIDRSPIHGLGLFAAEFIPKGKPIWRYVDGFDRKIPEAAVMLLPSEAQSYIRHYCGFLQNRCYLEAADNGRFINHSAHPNIHSEPPDDTDILYALRDIAVGEELTEDYRIFDVGWRRTNGVPPEE